METILIYGTGSVAEKVYPMLDLEKIEVLAFINSNPTIDVFHCHKVICENEISDYEFDYILICSGYVENIIRRLSEAGITRSKIVAFIYDDAETYRGISENISCYLNKMYGRQKIDSWLKQEKSISKIYPAVFWEEEYSINSSYKDFVREQTAKLISKKIYEQNISGQVAELGVYKGDFTIILSELYKDRELYLFDTFEGFADNDISSDPTLKNGIGESNKFKDTSVNYVFNRLNREGVIIKKGYFPQTFDLKEEITFCFVSIDFNLYHPVYAALDLFYPRLSRGGAILVSDYYAPFYKGTKKAVDEWCKENNKDFIPVADFYGSVIISK